MATNTSALKTFAQQTRIKLISLIKTKLQFVLNNDTAELRGYEEEIKKLRSRITQQGEDSVVEEVAYTWFNRIMALRFMDANGYNSPMIITPAEGQTRPEILQDAMAGTIDEELNLSDEDKLQPEPTLYRRLLVASCNLKHSSMPFLFEHITDYTELLLPDDLLSEQSVVSDIRNGMTDDDCQNVELMGWLYQFYITDRKADAEIKKGKKGGLKSDEQAAATQLFTPHWVVRYMVENSLGRIWMTLHPESGLINEMPYYIPTPEGQTDIIPSDIHSAQDIKFIDPCMGSGHILVYAFDLFTKMYEEEGVLHKDIPSLILQNNIFGIDIDPRCFQLASFALTMKARAYYSRYLRRTVNPNVIALQKIDHETIESAGYWDDNSLVWQFENIDTIGSLLKIIPEECNAIKVDNGLFGENQKVMKRQAEFLSGSYHCVVTNPPYLGKGFCDELSSFMKKNYPDSKADTMVAFMERLETLCSNNGKMAMINLPSWMFLSSFENLRRSLLEMCHIDSLIHMGRGIFGVDWGSVAFTYSKGQNNNDGSFFRLHERNFQHIYFQHIGQLFLQVLKNHSLKYDFSTYRDEDVTSVETFDFHHSDNGVKLYYQTSQKNFGKMPGSPIGYWVSENIRETFTRNRPLSAVCKPTQGLATADNGRFLRFWFEVGTDRTGFGQENAASAAESEKKWFPYNKGGAFRKWYGNQDLLVNWENDGFEIKHFVGPNGKLRSRPQNLEYFFKPSISWSKISAGSIAFRYYPQGFIFDVAGTSLFPIDDTNLEYYMACVNSTSIRGILKVISPTLNFEVGQIATLPIPDIEDKDIIISLTKKCISIEKTDWDAKETSWDFEKNDLIDIKDLFLKEGRLTDNFKLSLLMNGYKELWKGRFMKLHSNEEELNRQFIEIYGLQDELTPDVPLDEITILQKGEISIEDNQIVWHDDVIIKQLISYLVGSYMGRYSVNKPGLIIASQNQDLASLDLEVEGIDNGIKSTIAIDDDGIVPIIMEEDFFADDMAQRIESAIKKIFGEECFNENIKYINGTLGDDLRTYLFKNFYNEHIQMYSKRPIYWLFSSKMGDKKKKGYFKALVYMHRLESDTLSKLHADYVHPYLNKLELQLREAEEQTLRDDLSTTQHNKALKAADEMRDKVREVHAFEQQLVELASHRISIDLDDGVKTNYPKFYPLVEPIKGLESNDD